jgi:demethylmenaquinone methyltransferase/2-methoxy-6-polyprenyl-1,4-benzoquinol methylase
MGDYGRESRYPEQAGTYDATRSASPEVLGPLLRFLGAGKERTLVDIAGGTGNYAWAVRAHGFRPIAVDREWSMLVRSIGKIGSGRQVLGDAHRLPIGDQAADAAMIVSALHQFTDQRTVLSEAWRVIRDGPLVMQVFTKESLASAFVFDYFPGSEPRPGLHLTEEEVDSVLHDVGFTRVERERFVYRDLTDGTLHALHVDAEALADPARLRNTSFFQRLPPDRQRAGVAALRRDLGNGRLEDRVREGLRLAEQHGHGCVFAAWP